MFAKIKSFWRKEYWLIVVIAICVALLLSKEYLANPEVTKVIELLPTFGGLAFGLNTLISLVK